MELGRHFTCKVICAWKWNHTNTKISQVFCQQYIYVLFDLKPFTSFTLRFITKTQLATKTSKIFRPSEVATRTDYGEQTVTEILKQRRVDYCCHTTQANDLVVAISKQVNKLFYLYFFKQLFTYAVSLSNSRIHDKCGLMVKKSRMYIILHFVHYTLRL